MIGRFLTSPFRRSGPPGGDDRLLRGEIPPGGNCDIKTLARGAGVDRTAFYGKRPYAHLRTEFEDRLQQLQQASQTPDPRIAQITRLKADIDGLKERLTKTDQTIADLTDVRDQALARLVAQHDEIVRLREIANGTSRVIHLPANRASRIGPS